MKLLIIVILIIIYQRIYNSRNKYSLRRRLDDGVVEFAHAPAITCLLHINDQLFYLSQIFLFDLQISKVSLAALNQVSLIRINEGLSAQFDVGFGFDHVGLEVLL